MNILVYILFFTFIGSVVSLIGGILLLLKKKLTLKISHFLASFAAGTLLGAAFFDLLPESLAENNGVDIFLWTLVGILAFFLLERFIHHHNGYHPGEQKQVVHLIVIGDSVHNFIDGVVIAATFLISVPLGIVTSIAVAAHEIPQEIGDFGLLLSRGLAKNKVLLVNFLSSLFALLGALLTYSLGEKIEQLLPIFLSMAAGFFIYIAASDLIPEIHSRENQKKAFGETAALFLGVAIVWLVIFVLEGFVLS